MTLRPLACLVLVVALGIAGCAGQRNPFERNPAPNSYKADILSFLRTYLNDPTNVREASLAQPTPHRIGRDERYVVCTRFNPRNSTGRYLGVVDIAFTFQDGKLNRYFELASEEDDVDKPTRVALREVCKAATYQPFPELERLTR